MRGSQAEVTAVRGPINRRGMIDSSVTSKRASSNPDARVRVCENVPSNDKIVYRPDVINISSDINDSLNEELINNLINSSGYYLHEIPDVSMDTFNQHLDIVGQLALEAVATNDPLINLTLETPSNPPYPKTSETLEIPPYRSPPINPSSLSVSNQSYLGYPHLYTPCTPPPNPPSDPPNLSPF